MLEKEAKNLTSKMCFVKNSRDARSHFKLLIPFIKIYFFELFFTISPSICLKKTRFGLTIEISNSKKSAYKAFCLSADLSRVFKGKRTRNPQIDIDWET